MSTLRTAASPGVRTDAHRSEALAALAYALLILYGSLYPFSGWVGSAAPFAFLARPLSQTSFSIGDVVTNLFAYVPLGLLLCRVLARSMPVASATALAIVTGLALSFAVEVTQAFLPSRVQSTLDLLMNGAGTAIGAFAGAIPASRGRLAQRIRQLRSDWLAPGVLADIAVIGLAAWAASRLVPFVPSLDVGKFRSSLAPLAVSLAQPKSISAWLALSEALYWAGFGLVLRSIVWPGKPANAALTTLAACLLLAQIPIVGHSLTLESVIGCGAGIALAMIFARASLGARARLAFFLLFAGFCIAESLPAHFATAPRFNWIPFRGYMVNTENGIASLLEGIGLCVTLAWAARCATDATSRRWMAWSAGLLAVGAVFFLELAQRRIPGRTGDITMPLVFGFTWVAAWRARVPDAAAPASPRPQAPRPSAASTRALPSSLRVSALYYLAAWIGLSVAFRLVTQSAAAPYNVRELIYAGHPWRSEALLAAALMLTVGLPAWIVCWSLRARRGFLVWPLALLLNAYVAWLLVVNAVPTESLHDIVGSPILGWPGHTETCLRFLALHAATTLFVSGGAVMALGLLRHGGRAPAAAAWAAWALLLAPLLHWTIVTEAATDNLTELMRNGGSAATSAMLGAGAVLTFASGSFISAGLATRRRFLGVALAAACAWAAHALYTAGSEPALLKYGKVFSAMQFLLSPDRDHYAVGSALVARYAIAYLALTLTVVVLQQRAWRTMSARTRVSR